MAYNNQSAQAVAQRQPQDAATVAGSSTVEPEIIALAQAFLTASPEITLPQAVKAAYFFHNTGQVEGRDSYIGTTGSVTGKVLEGYRGVARDAAERNVGEVQIKYRVLTAAEVEFHEVKPTDLARACEVYQLRAWRIAQRMGQAYEPIVGIGIVKAGENLPAIGGMTRGKKCQNRAYKDAMRHVPGMAINGAEVLEDAEERDIHVEVPQGAQLTREQAIALVAEAERLSIAPPQPATAQQAAVTLAQNNARQRGTGPDWQGFGDDDERPDPDPNGFDELPSASAERNGGEATPTTKHELATNIPWQTWDGKSDAVAWAETVGFEHFHAVGIWTKVQSEGKINSKDMPEPYYNACLERITAGKTDAKAQEPTDADLDAQAAAEAASGRTFIRKDDAPQF